MLEQPIIIYAIVGFLAQMIDGTLGMAYGVSANTFLLSLGVGPVAASASVHIAEFFTTFASGISHFKLGNVDKELVKRLAFPGVIGGIIGAYLLTNFPGDALKPLVNIYLIGMGIFILYKAIRKKVQAELEKKNLSFLGLVGGFFDAVGGGGWGPIVTSTLLARGNNPRLTIGTVNLAEFFVTAAQAVTFVTLLGLQDNWQIIAGLALGGIMAAPLAALLCSKMPTRILMILVGLLVVFLNLRSIIPLLGK